MVNSINTNIAAYFAQANIGIAANASSTSVARLSSGNRIIKASDDVAGLAIGTSLRTNVATLKVARLNSALGTSLLQVVDGALSQIGEILQRQKAIAVQASSGSLSATQRGFLDQEFQQLVAEIDRIASGTNFNGVKLLDGTLSSVAQAITGQFVTNNPAAGGNYVEVFDTATNETAISALLQADDGTTAITNTQVISQIAFGGTLKPSVIGNFSNFVATFISGDGSTSAIVDMSFEIGGRAFQANNVDLSANFDDGTAQGGSQAIVFTEVVTGSEVAMTITVTVSDLDQGVIDSQPNLMSRLGDYVEDALEATYVTQQRVISADASETSVGSALAGIAAGAVTLTTYSQNTAATDDPATSYVDANNYGQVTSVTVTKTGDASDANGQITVVINGEEFELFDLLGSTDSDAGILLATDTLTLTRVDGENPGRTETIGIVLTGLTSSIDLTTDEGAQSLADALLAVLSGVDYTAPPTGEAISFQVGVSSADALSVSLDSAQTADLYANASLNVLTADAAVIAADAIDVALDTVTTIRATVGALQSRFNFATANIDSTIQNQDAARGELLDTDIASEATAYATSQVKLQAGISVLAQANQQLQSLLKLIG